MSESVGKIPSDFESACSGFELDSDLNGIFCRPPNIRKGVIVTGLHALKSIIKERNSDLIAEGTWVQL